VLQFHFRIVLSKPAAQVAHSATVIFKMFVLRAKLLKKSKSLVHLFICCPHTIFSATAKATKTWQYAQENKHCKWLHNWNGKKKCKIRTVRMRFRCAKLKYLHLRS